jgi:tetratricopeptide (TPR) repeat protein
MLGKSTTGEPARAHAFVAGGGTKQGLTLDQARELQDRLLATVTAEGEVSKKINAAAQLMTAGLYEAAIDAYEAIAQRHPEELAACESQIGAARFFLGQHEEAIRHYELARQHGADAGMMEDNIKEAREALAAGRAVGA